MVLEELARQEDAAHAREREQRLREREQRLRIERAAEELKLTPEEKAAREAYIQKQKEADERRRAEAGRPLQCHTVDKFVTKCE